MTTQMMEFNGFFALFPGPKKVRRSPASRVRECSGVSAESDESWEDEAGSAMNAAFVALRWLRRREGRRGGGEG